MKRMLLGFVATAMCLPASATACLFPTPKAVAWASCAISAMPAREGKSLVELEARLDPTTEDYNRVLAKQIGKWQPIMTQRCGSYARLRLAEVRRLRLSGDQYNHYAPEDGPDAITTLLLMRRMNRLADCGKPNGPSR